MPIYEYQCRKCNAHFEIMQKMTDKPLTKCIKCGGRLEKQWSSTSFQLKGTGWYATDYAAKKSEEKSETKDQTTTSTEVKTEKTDEKTTKAEEKKATTESETKSSNKPPTLGKKSTTGNVTSKSSSD